MANLRFIHDNAADRAMLAASTTAGALVAANMQRNEKSAVWRSTATTATVTAVWAVDELIDSMAIGWTNLTALATITVECYTLAADTVPASTMVVSPDTNLAGGPVQVQVWMTSASSVERVDVTISDPTNPDGCIEASRLSIGKRYEMSMNAASGPRLGIVSRSNTSRAESGDVRSEDRWAYRTLEIDFQFIEAADTEFLMMLSRKPRADSLFVSMLPGAGGLRQSAYAFFAILAGSQSFNYPLVARWATGLSLEEIA